MLCTIVNGHPGALVAERVLQLSKSITLDPDINVDQHPLIGTRALHSRKPHTVDN